MTTFLLELYVPNADCAAVTDGAARLDRAAAELTAERGSVRLVRTIFVPEDETCYVLIDAVSVEAVHETARRASLAVERVVETALATHD